MSNRAGKQRGAVAKKSRKKPAELTDEELKIALAKRLDLPALTELYASKNKAGTGS
jgi:hypothetical protein